MKAVSHGLHEIHGIHLLPMKLSLIGKTLHYFTYIHIDEWSGAKASPFSLYIVSSPFCSSRNSENQCLNNISINTILAARMEVRERLTSRTSISRLLIPLLVQEFHVPIGNNESEREIHFWWDITFLNILTKNNDFRNIIQKAY